MYIYTQINMIYNLHHLYALLTAWYFVLYIFSIPGCVVYSCRHEAVDVLSHGGGSGLPSLAARW